MVEYVTQTESHADIRLVYRRIIACHANRRRCGFVIDRNVDQVTGAWIEFQIKNLAKSRLANTFRGSLAYGGLIHKGRPQIPFNPLPYQQ
jgi:hypothetical protein